MRCAVFSAVVFVTLVECAVTKQARNVDTSGFLLDRYPQMRQGKGDEALLVYRNPHVDWATKAIYKNVLLDPVMIWRGHDSKIQGSEHKDVQVLADAFYALPYQEPAKDYEMVTEPGPKTFRMQAALS